MQIKESQNLVTITTDFSESIFVFFWNAGKGIIWWVIFLGFIVISTRGFELVIGLVVVLPMGWLLISMFFGDNEIHTAQINKNKKSLTIVNRWPLTLWIPKITKYSLQEVRSLTFGSNQETEKRLAINFKNNEQEIFAGSATIKDTERIGIALHVPLNINVSGEMITYIPWDTSEAEVIPTPCMQCGAPLPKITHEMKNVKCDHCGMTMVIEWHDGRMSYKVQRNSPFQE
jgi:hypothetical protein